jgi:hypothetical protein
LSIFIIIFWAAHSSSISLLSLLLLARWYNCAVIELCTDWRKSGRLEGKEKRQDTGTTNAGWLPLMSQEDRVSWDAV